MLAPTRCEPALLPSQTAAHLFIRLTADRCWRLPPGHPEGRRRPRLYLARSCDGGISLSTSYQDINQSIPALRSERSSTNFLPYSFIVFAIRLNTH